MSICFGKSHSCGSIPASLKLKSYRAIRTGIIGFALSSTALAASDPSAVLSQASQAFSGGKPVSSVEMTGRAQWTSGSTKDNGPAKLAAKVTGENIAEFDLSNGTRTEKQSALAEDRICTWSGKDGVEHDAASANCWTATVWFLPHLALQSSSLPAALTAVHDTSAATEKSSGSPHIQHQATFVPEKSSKAYSTLMAQIQGWSKTDLVFDPATMLPRTLKYNVHPDDNSFVNIQVEVRYSNYKNVSGVELPMRIERYVNGNLQVSVDIDSATVN